MCDAIIGSDSRLGSRGETVQSTLHHITTFHHQLARNDFKTWLALGQDPEMRGKQSRPEGFETIWRQTPWIS
jgi:hypothetical protein